MKHKIERYLKILKIEFEDLESDIISYEEMLEKKHDQNEITDYVFLENLSIIKMELLGIKEMESAVDALSGEYESLDDLIDNIYRYFEKKVKDANLPDVVFVLIKRKLDKVYKYMSIKAE